MALLTIENLPGAVINVPSNTNLLAATHAAGFDWMHACGAKGRCTTCRIVVEAGMEYLGPLTSAEQRYRASGRLRSDERLMCQVLLPDGEVKGRVPEATKLPHMQYS